MEREMHICNREAEISRIATIVEDLKHEINGNGQPGLSKTVPQLVVATAQLSTDIKNLAVVVSGIVKFQTESEMKDKLIQEYEAKSIISKRDKQWLTGTIIASALTIITILIGTGIAKNHTANVSNSKADRQVVIIDSLRNDIYNK